MLGTLRLTLTEGSFLDKQTHKIVSLRPYYHVLIEYKNGCYSSFNIVRFGVKSLLC